MAVQIQKSKDGTLANVTPSGQLQVISEGHSLPHHVSRHTENSYQLVVIDATVTATTDQLFHIKNTSATKRLVVHSIRVQAITDIGVTAEVTEYWSLIVGDTVASGGVAGTVTNLNQSSGKVAEVTATITDPTMDAVGVEIDRMYNLSDGSPHEFYCNDAIILGLNDTIHVAFVSGAASGHVRGAINFSMIDNA